MSGTSMHFNKSNSLVNLMQDSKMQTPGQQLNASVLSSTISAFPQDTKKGVNSFMQDMEKHGSGHSKSSTYFGLKQAQKLNQTEKKSRLSQTFSTSYLHDDVGDKAAQNLTRIEGFNTYLKT